MIAQQVFADAPPGFVENVLYMLGGVVLGAWLMARSDRGRDR